ncbi:AAA family ATPase [Streptomyces acidiscabies]|uniref:AAA family ATPase n=1 Tax=Streptomyces acidiscabies TaxID=42234 RepID=UPI0038F66224
MKKATASSRGLESRTRSPVLVRHQRDAHAGRTRVRDLAGWSRQRVHERHGRYGVDHPESEYFAREAPAVAEVRRELVELVTAGRSVVVDHGLWRRKEREDWKNLVREAGGVVRLLYFPVAREELLRRLNERNRRDDANALTVTESTLDDFFARFEPPHGEGEEIIEPDAF